jgi:hypothetical protein
VPPPARSGGTDAARRCAQSSLTPCSIGSPASSEHRGTRRPTCRRSPRKFPSSTSPPMELIAILNRCQHFRGFVHGHAHFSPDHRRIEVSVRPRKRSSVTCSRFHRPAPGYDQLSARRFGFIPLWGFFVFFLYTMRRVDCPRCGAVTVEEVPWNKAKVTMRRSYGFRTYRVLELALYQSLGKLPEPESTHEFFYRVRSRNGSLCVGR